MENRRQYIRRSAKDAYIQGYNDAMRDVKKEFNEFVYINHDNFFKLANKFNVMMTKEKMMPKKIRE